MILSKPMQALQKQAALWKVKKVIKRNLQFRKPYKLHIGCGTVRFENWINTDWKKLGTVDLTFDITKGIPFENDSCSLIYHEHVLEHLTIAQADRFLKECYRVLEPGGTMRIAMPSLEHVAKKYCADDWRDQEWLTWPEYQFITTRAEMFNISMRSWGHQWLYDQEELQRRLREVGFKVLSNKAWGNSAIPELMNRETRKDSLLICEIQK